MKMCKMHNCVGAALALTLGFSVAACDKTERAAPIADANDVPTITITATPTATAGPTGVSADAEAAVTATASAPTQTATVAASAPTPTTTSATPTAAPTASAPTATAVPSAAVKAAAPAATSADKAAAPPPLVPASTRLAGKNFTLDVASPGCRVELPCVVTLRLAAAGAYHVNKEYPYKFIAAAAPGVQYLGKGDASTFSRASGDFHEDGEKAATMTVRFKPTATGQARVSGTFKMSVCSAENCQIETQAVSLAVPTL
jgi:hypothetical protein